MKNHKTCARSLQTFCISPIFSRWKIIWETLYLKLPFILQLNFKFVVVVEVEVFQVKLTWQELSYRTYPCPLYLQWEPLWFSWYSAKSLAKVPAKKHCLQFKEQNHVTLTQNSNHWSLIPLTHSGASWLIVNLWRNLSYEGYVIRQQCLYAKK